MVTVSNLSQREKNNHAVAFLWVKLRKRNTNAKRSLEIQVGISLNSIFQDWKRIMERLSSDFRKGGIKHFMRILF